jgi:predicted protein tyrosine phosphatase
MLRSPTAERVFMRWPGIEVRSAGTNADATQPLTDELFDWADMIVVMEKHHRNRVQKKFGSRCREKRMVVLEIPDEYEFMDEALVRLLKAKMARYLPV